MGNTWREASAKFDRCIDVVMPIPDSSRPRAAARDEAGARIPRRLFSRIAMSGRTFIMPGQGVRRRSVRQKLSALPTEFRGKNGCWSTIRSCAQTSREIVHMAREAGANRVIFASAAPPVRSPTYTASTCQRGPSLIAHGIPTRRSAI